MTKQPKQCNRALKHLYNMLDTNTAGKVPKAIRRHINHCNFCREKLIALQTEMVTTIDETVETKQTLQVPMKEQERVDIKKKSLFVRIKIKILAIFLPGKRQDLS